MNSCILYSIYDEYIVSDIKKKVGDFHETNLDEVANHVIRYVSKHYNIYEKTVTPKISNFYVKHKKFTRFILISISLFDATSDINVLAKKNLFNKRSRWEVEHIIPQSQKYNKFNAKNSRLKNRIGNLTLLTKQTNVLISNKSFFAKRRLLTENEQELRVNDIFKINKTNVSKRDIYERENYLNDLIFKMFIENDGKIFKDKLKTLEA